jgi:hypothetical protein
MIRVGGLTTVLLFSISSAGCLPIGVPVPRDENIGQVVKVDAGEIGITTKQEILARWGEPRTTDDDDRVIVYTWDHKDTKWCGTVIFLFLPAGGGQFSCSDPHTFHLMLIQFDENDRARRVKHIELSGSKRDAFDARQYVKDWARNEGEFKP